MSNELTDMPDFAKEMLKTFHQPKLQALLSDIKSIAGYRLSIEQESIFKEFHNYITNPEPSYITELRQDPKTEHWYHKHVGGILGHTQSALACVFYHRENLLNVEKAVFELEGFHDCKDILPQNSGMGLGSAHTAKLDFEYQACILAMRRCLEYMTYGFCSYFKNHINDFRKLPKALDCFIRKKSPVAIALSEAQKIWLPKFDSIVSGEHGTSIRDKISHFEYIPAGVLNLSSRGLVLVGGGEELNLGKESSLLSEILDARIINLIDCIQYFIKVFIESEKACVLQNSKSSSPQ